jgi:hypothetical protein
MKKSGEWAAARPIHRRWRRSDTRYDHDYDDKLRKLVSLDEKKNELIRAGKM